MDITEPITPSDRDLEAGLVYDGFMSYSHAADDLLAPRLQAGLQRFAKPWWKRRALRVFRDEASLSANPHLWSSITKALDQSAWFVLLLSPEAAESPWVDREVEYWLEHKDASRIVPVVTDGEFGWTAGNISPKTDSAPPSLFGVFGEEPRWVDLRFARSEEQLDLNNARFRNAVADIASALRGVPKDELESEEVKQHRRTIRTAGAAGIALLGFLILAVAFGAFALSESRRANTQADRATAEADRASELAQQEAQARQSAENAAAAEQEQRLVAQQNEALAVQEADRANEFARQMLDIGNQRAASEPDFVEADSEWFRVPVGGPTPDNPRLDFLYAFCPGIEQCTRDAVFVHPELLIGTGPWIAYEPFHIRHGFVNTDVSPDRSGAGLGFDVHVFITRTEGPPLDGGVFEIGQTYRFTSDYVVHQTEDRCGPGSQSQTEPQPCDLFVNDFPEGLPPGRYSFWVEWLAPCRAWTVIDLCQGPLQVVSLFGSSVNSPFYHDEFTSEDDTGGAGNPSWPFDLWTDADPLPDQ